MSKFKKKTATSQEIPTSALPDIIFMLLFFFMVTTVMRETEILVEQKIPRAEQLLKMQKKTLVKYIYIGKPKDTDKYGEEPRIQLNDALATPGDVIQFVNQERDKLDEAERDRITMALKVDVEAKMGIVSDVQQQLREANALKVLYTSLMETDEL